MLVTVRGKKASYFRELPWKVVEEFYGQSLGLRQTWVGFQVLLFTSCMSSEKLFNLSGPCLSCKRGNNTYFLGLLYKLDEVMCAEDHFGVALCGCLDRALHNSWGYHSGRL